LRVMTDRGVEKTKKDQKRSEARKVCKEQKDAKETRPLAKKRDEVREKKNSKKVEK